MTSLDTLSLENENTNTLLKAESNTELNTAVSLSHSVSITGVADLQHVTEVETRGQNLCSASLGAKVLFATDEWFATADNLLKDTPPEFDEHAYCEQVSSSSYTCIATGGKPDYHSMQSFFHSFI